MGNLVFQATLGGQVNLVGPNTASTFNLNVPAVAGTLVTTGDTGTVTNTMLASSAYTAPGTIGSGTPNSGAFTTLSASSTVSGTGFSTYLASPPAIGGTAAAAGSFTALSYTTTFTGGTGIVNLGSGQFYKDASGNVGMGTNSPSFSGSSRKALTLNAPTGQLSILELGVNGALTGYLYSNASQTSLTSVGATPLLFETNGAERARIDSSGNLLVGATSFAYLNNNSVLLGAGGSAGQAIFQHISGTASGSTYAAFTYNAGAIGSIIQNGTTGVLYNLTSDYRLKNNQQPLTGAKEFVMALQPKKWEWWDGSGEGVGFIAHEFMEVAKYSGHGEKDAVDEEGKIIAQSIQPSSSEVMANLVSLLQEQQALIENLTTRLAALEGAK